MAESTYVTGFQDGLRAAVDLMRSGATGDDLALLLESDPAVVDPRGYADRLVGLRAVLDTSGLFSGATS